ncbi:MAG: hypothetical protein ACKVQB_02400 [Bacteroidia bacterium]
MKKIDFFEFIKKTFTSSEVTVYSKKSPEEIFSEMEFIFDRKNVVDYTVNLTGKIDSNYNFELTHKFSLEITRIGGVEGMNAEIKGAILDNVMGSKVNMTIIPNSLYRWLFIGGLLSIVIILLLTIFGMRAHDTIAVISFALFGICPYSVIRSYFAKQSLLKKVMVTFDLKELPEN